MYKRIRVNIAATRRRIPSMRNAHCWRGGCSNMRDGTWRRRREQRRHVVVLIRLHIVTSLSGGEEASGRCENKAAGVSIGAGMAKSEIVAASKYNQWRGGSGKEGENEERKKSNVLFIIRISTFMPLPCSRAATHVLWHRRRRQ